MTGSAAFPFVAEHLYFHGQSVVDSLLHAMQQFHLTGAHPHNGDQAFIDDVTRRLYPNDEHRDLRNAVAIIFADLVCNALDPAGGVSVESVSARWGAACGALLATLLSVTRPDPHRDRPDNPITRNEFIRHVSLFAPHRLPEIVRSVQLPSSLPLIDFLMKEVGVIDDSICALVCIQHLFGSTVPLIRALARHLDPSAVFILGKPYSTSHLVLWQLRRECGYYVHPGSHQYRGTQEHHLEADEHIASLLMLCLRSMASQLAAGRRILMLDDGGRAIRLLHSRAFADAAHHFRCVEQTRRGVRELEGVDLSVPVVNVAESWAKLEHESRIIAASVRLELERSLARLGAAGIRIGNRVLVIGFGAIGQAVSVSMQEAGWDVGVWDVVEQRLDNAGRHGYRAEASLVDALPEYDVIVGCTGEVVLGPAEYGRLRDGAVLVSASSSDVEFQGWLLRSHAASFSGNYRYVDEFNLVYERFQNRLLYLGDVDHPCHFLYVARFAGKHVFLVNGGFPVNMTGEVDPIPAEVIQLTRGLLYAGAVQASRIQPPGLSPLPMDRQRTLVRRYYELVEGAGVKWP